MLNQLEVAGHPQAQSSGKPPDDLCLLRCVRDGHLESFGMLHVHLYDRLRCIASAVLREDDPAEDAASEAILRIYRDARSGSFPDVPEAAAVWIKNVARSCAFRQRSHPHTVRGEFVYSLPDPRNGDVEDSDSCDRGTQSLDAAKALRQLPRGRGEAVRMHLAGASYAMISRRLGVTVAGARNRVERGLLTLVAKAFSRRQGRHKAERAELLSAEDRANVRNAVAAVRAQWPGIRLRPLAAEVCRRTHILIMPGSASAFLLVDLHARRN